MYHFKAITNRHHFKICPKQKAQKNQRKVCRTGEFYLQRRKNRIQHAYILAIENFIGIKILKIKELLLGHKLLIKNYRIKVLFLTESRI